MQKISCYSCHHIQFVEILPDTCPLCGATNIEEISHEQFHEGLESGAIYSIDVSGKRVPPPSKLPPFST